MRASVLRMLLVVSLLPGYIGTFAEQVIVQLAQAGTLSTKIEESQMYQITDLKVVGEINGTDVSLIRKMAGRDNYGKKTSGILVNLDLSEAKIVEGGNEYYATYSASTSDDVIGDYMFFLTNLKSIVLPNTIKRIGTYSFGNCYELLSIAIPNSVVTIGNSAFEGCIGMQSVTIGSGVTSMGTSAFASCEDVCKLILLPNSVPSKCYFPTNDERITYVSNENYDSRNTGGGTLKVYKYLSSMFDVDGVVYVPVDPVQKTCDVIDCNYSEKTKSVNIAKVISYKGIAMLPQTINANAFRANPYITSVLLSNDGAIGASAFYKSNNIECVCIDGTITNIGNKAFKSIAGLKQIDIDGEVGSTCFDSFTSCENLEQLKINGKIGVLREKCFADCAKLSTIDVKGEVEMIGDGCFFGCAELSSVTFTGKVGTIGDNCFENCFQGQNGTVVMNCELSALGVKSFYNCAKLTQVKITGSVDNIPESCFEGCSNLANISLPNALTRIATSAFKKCSSLRDIVIPNQVSAIEASSFYGCGSLVDVTFPVELGSLGNEAFSYCVGLKKVEINNKLKEINDRTFLGCNSLASLTIPANVNVVGNNVFNGCGSLKSLVIENGEEALSLGYRYDGKFNCMALFNGCPLDSVYIGRNLSYMKDSNYGYSPFYRNTALRAVKIGDNIEEIFDNEFYGCTNLKSVSVGENVKKIGNYAFSGCSGLDSFLLGQSIKTIGDEAFSDCSSMKKFVSHCLVPPTCGNEALDDINKWECTLYVPTGCVSGYQAANQWQNFFFIEEGDPTATGIEKTNVRGQNIKEFSRYSVNGQRLTAPIKGVNIVKYSDGSVRKEIVK